MEVHCLHSSSLRTHHRISWILRHHVVQVMEARTLNQHACVICKGKEYDSELLSLPTAPTKRVCKSCTVILWRMYWETLPMKKCSECNYENKDELRFAYMDTRHLDKPLCERCFEKKWKEPSSPSIRTLKDGRG